MGCSTPSSSEFLASHFYACSFSPVASFIHLSSSPLFPWRNFYHGGVPSRLSFPSSPVCGGVPSHWSPFNFFSSLSISYLLYLVCSLSVHFLCRTKAVEPRWATSDLARSFYNNPLVYRTWPAVGILSTTLLAIEFQFFWLYFLHSKHDLPPVLYVDIM